jgi:3-isopropylmalate dehydratase small subunit
MRIEILVADANFRKGNSLTSALSSLKKIKVGAMIEDHGSINENFFIGRMRC